MPSSAFSKSRLLPLLALVGALGVPAAAVAKNVMVIGPHPDDETLLAAGRIRAAVEAGDNVTVVVVTNGDAHGVDAAPKREGESVAAAGLLGVAESKVVFLGYPDGYLMSIYTAADPTTVITPAVTGKSATYGFRGLGGTDYHTRNHGAGGAYNHVTLVADLGELFEEFQPDEIFTTSNFDDHSDHQVVGLTVTEALVAARKGSVGAFTAAHTTLLQGMVWPRSTIGWPDLVGVTRWPDPAGIGGCAGDLPFPSPQPEEMTQLEWARARRFEVPASMMTANDASNLKCKAILAYSTQAIPYLLSFARRDEFFWANDFGANVALTATVTASSEDAANGQGKGKAVDGVIDGSTNEWGANEWVSTELSGAWMQLTWGAPQKVAQVNLYGRQRTSQDVLAGRLDFSDGSHVDVAAFPQSGRLVPVTFAPKTTSYVKFTVTSANPDGNPVGLSEFQVLGFPASASANIAPTLVAGPYLPGAPFIGPGDGPDTITSAQHVDLLVAANDLNGNALSYQWSLDGVNIPAATGTSVTFTPGVVGVKTVYAVGATVSDGAGGVSSNVNYITVIPAANGLTVAPASVQMGTAAVATVLLATPAPPGGTVVAVSSSDPAVAVPSGLSDSAVPISTVTVPEGDASASFFVFGKTVLADSPVTITATIGGTPYTAPLTVTLAAVAPPVVLTGANLVVAQIGGANWTTSPATLVSDPPVDPPLAGIVVTLDAGVAPDTTNTATRIEVPTAGNAWIKSTVFVTMGQPYLFSFYAKNNGGTNASYSIVGDCNDEPVVPVTPYIGQIDGTSWTEITVPFTAPAACNRVNVYALRDSGAPVDVLVWGAAVYKYVLPPAELVTLTPSLATPHQITRPWAPVTFTAFARGSAGYNYKFSVSTDGTTFNTVQDYGPLSRWTWSTSPVPAPGTYHVKVEVKTDLLAASPDASDTYLYVLTQAAAGKLDDFDGDGKSDLLWFNGVSGQVYLYLMNGKTVTKALPLGSAPAGWAIAGTGDFNGDGHADVLWFNAGTGQVYTWLTNGAGVIGAGTVGYVSPGWAIAGVADFDGDGKSDIVWFNAGTGQVYIYLMNGTALKRGVSVGNGAAGWGLSGIGDLDGNGTPDLVWFNAATGQVAEWLMSGPTVSIADVFSSVPVGSGWSLKKVADLDGDGRADLLWLNESTFQAFAWLMNGRVITSYGSPGTASSGWTIARAADFDGDGKADVLWSKTSGGTTQTYLWLMSGFRISTSGSPGSAASDWQIVP